MTRWTWLAATLALITPAGVLFSQVPAGLTRVDPATASSPVVAAVTTAEAAVADLQRTLLERLTRAMAEGGPPAALVVCRDEAQQLTREVGTRHGVAIGRTSHRVRNRANAPRPWAAELVAAHSGRKVTDAQPVTVDLDGRIGMLRPIGTQPFCETCHGARQTVDAAIGDVLKAAYPEDEAVGFAAGDLRGWFWVEADVAR
jgi:hypothetical protein